MPEPTGPVQTLRAFSLGEPTITRDCVHADHGAWRIEVTGAQTVRLFDVKDRGVEQCMLTYRADMKTEAMRGCASLEMWCRIPGRGEFFSKGLQQKASGTTDWTSYTTPFYLKKGQRPDLIKLNLVTEGNGTVW